MNKRICCFGEVLWDLLPTGKIAGGAPMNVAVHAQQFGLDATMISAVGNDELGSILKDFLSKRNISTDTIQTDDTYQTGIVEVILNENGSPSYTIIEPVAWDFIDLTESTIKAVKNSDIFVFGSLALRNEHTKNTLIKLLPNAHLRVLDVNLREPFYSPSLIKELLGYADVVKVNDDELELICSWLGQNSTQEANAKFLRKLFNLTGLIVTRGGSGAFFVDSSNVISENKGFKIKVVDTIGSGDSFLASFLKQYSAGESPEKCLAYACAVGALVATHQGATPIISDEEIQVMLNQNS